MIHQIPVYVNVRDRASDLKTLVVWLEKIGCERIVLLDNDSSYPPLLEYLEATPHEVVRLDNLGSRSIWKANLYPKDEWFVYTDPDVIPVKDCPSDVIDHLMEMANRWGYSKAALGLYLNDVPENLDCLGWERSLVSPERQLAPGVFDSLVDTTFAVYGPGTPFTYKSLRLGHPYQARHMSWYLEGQDLDEENSYYLERAIKGMMGSSWAEVQRCPK